MDKKLMRREEGKIILGVCTGIAKYFDIDVTLVRICWIIASLFFGIGIFGVLAYILCAIIMPNK